MQYDLVFEGGGAKGMAFVGAMREFEAAGHTIGRIIGSSAGAITAASLAAGYSAAEMYASLTEMAGDKPVFTTFLGEPPAPADLRASALAEFFTEVDVSRLPGWAEERLENRVLVALAGSGVGRHLLSFFEYGGFYSADAFVTWFERKLSEGQRPDGRPRDFGKMTFAEMHRETGVDLSLTASDTTLNLLLILNHRTAPDLPVVWGTRMSMSFPLLWQEVVWRAEWGNYHTLSRGVPIEVPMAGHTLVDGGLLSNFPIELLVSRADIVRTVMGPDASDAVAGFLIDERLEVPDAPPPESAKPALAKLGSLRTAKRIQGLIDTMTQARDKMVIDENRQRVVRLPAKTYGTVEFGMVGRRREALIEAAAAVTKDYFIRQAAGGGLESLEGLSTDESDRIALDILDMGL